MVYGSRVVFVLPLYHTRETIPPELSLLKLSYLYHSVRKRSSSDVVLDLENFFFRFLLRPAGERLSRAPPDLSRPRDRATPALRGSPQPSVFPATVGVPQSNSASEGRGKVPPRGRVARAKRGNIKKWKFRYDRAKHALCIVQAGSR